MTGHDFDERAATWDDDPAKVERARFAADAIRSAVPLGPSTRLLEYGAGTGLVAQFLRDWIGPVTLADPSAGMRAVMAGKVEAGVLPDDARIWDLDLASDPVPDDRFDLIVTVMVLHHVTPLEPVLEAFATLLDEGGHLCIVDLEEEDGTFHGEGFHGHHGFARTALISQLEAAGFGGITVDRCHEIVRDGETYPLFLAVAST